MCVYVCVCVCVCVHVCVCDSPLMQALVADDNAMQGGSGSDTARSRSHAVCLECALS